MAAVAVIGAGSWGTALALLLHKNGHQVTVWSPIESEIAMLNQEREHKDKLPGVKLPEDMDFTCDIAQAAEEKDRVKKRGTKRELCGNSGTDWKSV